VVRAPSYGPAVLCSFVLHLLPAELAEGRVVGQVEDVGRGVTAAVRNLGELADFLHRSTQDPGSVILGGCSEVSSSPSEADSSS